MYSTNKGIKMKENQTFKKNIRMIIKIYNKIAKKRTEKRIKQTALKLQIRM